MIRALLLAVVMAGTVLTVPAARADWLVTKDGSRIETQGSWEVRGRLVVFTTSKGDLSSMRATELDLGASQVATEEALAPPPAPAPVAARPAPASLVITDADVEHVEEEPAEEEEGDEVVPAGDLVVTSWQQSEPPDGQGIAIRGTLRNNGQQVATQVRLTVEVLDREGQVVGTQEAVLTSSTLGAAEALSFRVLFPDVQVIDTARFSVTNSAFNTARSKPVAKPPAAKPPGTPAAAAEGVGDEAEPDLPAEDDGDYPDDDGSGFEDGEP